MTEGNRNCKRATLCWLCQNARADRCTWFVDFTPVDGWDAIPTEIIMNTNGENKIVDSFNVFGCPKFLPYELENSICYNGKNYHLELSPYIKKLAHDVDMVSIEEPDNIPKSVLDKVIRAWIRKNHLDPYFKLHIKDGYHLKWIERGTA